MKADAPEAVALREAAAAWAAGLLAPVTDAADRDSQRLDRDLQRAALRFAAEHLTPGAEIALPPLVEDLLADVLEQYARRTADYRACGGNPNKGVYLKGEQTIYLPRKLLNGLARLRKGKGK